jgi:hypothetical protein
MSEELHIKLLGLSLSGIRRMVGGGKPKLPKDGDGDGMYTMPGSDKDNTPVRQALSFALQSLRRFGIKKFEIRNDDKNKRELINRWLQEAQKGGFTTDRNLAGDVKQGISVGRDKHGLSADMGEVFDESGEVKEEAVDRVMAWLEYHGNGVFSRPLEGAREVGVGGWVEKGKFYLDVVDLYENNEKNREQAHRLGKEQNQKAIALLEALWRAKETNAKEDWDRAFLTTDGDGSSTIPWETFDEIVKMMAEARRQASSTAGSRVLSSPKGEKSHSFRILVIE